MTGDASCELRAASCERAGRVGVGARQRVASDLQVRVRSSCGGLRVQGLAALHLEAFRLAAPARACTFRHNFGPYISPAIPGTWPAFQRLVRTFSSTSFWSRLTVDHIPPFSSQSGPSLTIQLVLPPLTPSTFNLDGAATEIPASLILHPLQPVRGLISPAQLPPESIATAQPHLKPLAKQRLTSKIPHSRARLLPTWFPYGNVQS
jgi:hypothetical protein